MNIQHVTVPATPSKEAHKPKVEVVVVTCNSSQYAEACLDSILEGGYQVIVVDNASSDGTVELIRKRWPNITLIENSLNIGYGSACNLGFASSKADYVLFSNADVVYPPDSIRQMSNFLARCPDAAVVAPQLIYPDGTWQLSYADTPSVWTALKDIFGVSWARRKLRRALWPIKVDRRPRRVLFVAGAAMLVRRTAFAATHGFDESFYFYAEESDLCMRLNKQGWGVVFNPTVNVVHVAGGHSVRVDRSDRFVREMVNSQSKLARKHLPPKQAQFYLECQWLFFKVAGFAWRVAGTILCNRLTAGVSAKVELFRMYSDVFREYMSDGSVRVRRTGGVL